MSKDYGPVEDLIFKGFLTCSMDIGGIPIVVKSLNSVEFGLYDLQSYAHNTPQNVIQCYFLAYATLFFDNVNMLVDRPHSINTLAEYYQHLPEKVHKALLHTVVHLNTQSAKYLKQVEAYSYGPLSRQLWYMHNGANLCDSSISGIPGTQLIGMNTHQKLWNYFNRMEDEDVTYMREYNLSKFIVSPHASKHVQKLDSTDKQRMQEREQKRRALHLGTAPSVAEGLNEVRITNESAEELMEQMEKSVKGEKDYHDMVIERHQKGIREAYLRKMQEDAERKRTVQQERMEDRDDILAHEGYTAEEMGYLLRASDERRRERMGSASESTVSPEDRDRNLLRWGMIDESDLPTGSRPQDED